MKEKIRDGLFSVIDSFAIKRRNEFYMIGNLLEGEVRENWLINIKLNKSFAVSVKIFQTEDIEISNNGGKYKLLL